MGITFAVCLKFYDTAEDWREDERNGTKSAMLARTALKYGYSLRFLKKCWDYWVWDCELPFEIKASPMSDATRIFAEEFREPLNWEKICFPTLLLELWQLPEVEAAMFMRIADGSEPLKKLLSVQGAKEKPGPVSPYLMMNEIVALRARRDVPNRRYYLNKKAHVLRPLD